MAAATSAGFYNRDQQTFSGKGQRVNVLGCVGWEGN